MLMLLMAYLLPTHAVLKEANLDTTLYMLRTELSQYHLDLEKQNKLAKEQHRDTSRPKLHHALFSAQWLHLRLDLRLP